MRRCVSERGQRQIVDMGGWSPLAVDDCAHRRNLSPGCLPRERDGGRSLGVDDKWACDLVKRFGNDDELFALSRARLARAKRCQQ